MLRYRQAAVTVLLLGLTAGGLSAESVWEHLQRARPDLARKGLSPKQTLEWALIAEVEGDIGRAWKLLRQLEGSYQPGQQPPEFFWLRARLLANQNWKHASQNLVGLTEHPCPPSLRLRALGLLALGRTQRQQAEQARQTWAEAARSATAGCSVPDRLQLALDQAEMLSQEGRPDHALVVLSQARALAQSQKFRALETLILVKMARAHQSLRDWNSANLAYQQALRLSRSEPQDWLVRQSVSAWVDLQLARSADLVAATPCLTLLQQAESWFSGSIQGAVVGQRARLLAEVGQKSAALDLLDRALAMRPEGRAQIELLAQRYQITPDDQAEMRRKLLRQLQAALIQLGTLEPEDPLRSQIPDYGIEAVLGDTYLPHDPASAASAFQQALARASDRAERLRVLGYQVQCYSEAGLQTQARQSTRQILTEIGEGELDSKALAVVCSLILEVDQQSRKYPRLFLTDELRAPAEAASTVLAAELLRRSALQAQLQQELSDRMHRASDDFSRGQAYLDRARLLKAQVRDAEALLAAEKAEQFAGAVGNRVHLAQARLLQAELLWESGLSARALESLKQVEEFKPQTNRAGGLAMVDLLKAYFLLRESQPRQALEVCASSKSPWGRFLAGRCWLTLGDRSQAAACFAGCSFEDPLGEVGRLVYLARSTDEPDGIYEKAYAQAIKLDSLALRDVALDWSASLRRRHQQGRASQLEAEAAGRLRALLQEYPPAVRERLMDLPKNQGLLAPGSLSQVQEQPLRQSRRDFLARLNQLRQRYPKLDNELAISPSDLVALQENLPAHRVLVQYFAGEQDLIVMRVDSQGFQLSELAVERSVLQEWIQQIRQALSRRQSLPEQPARRLYQALVAPLGADLKGKQIQVIPSGFFWYLPWDVLLSSDGHFLVEHLEWSCQVPSDLLRSSESRPALPLEKVIALGGSNPDLPATAREARMVASFFPEGRAWVEGQATITALQQVAPQAELLHLAAHSGLSPTLNQTFIELKDGPFTLDLVYGLRMLPGSRVVLSSCESALGQADPGREVSSLATAFLASGASSVVATLWRVEDQTSEAFFRRFYPRLQELGSVSAALRQARLDSLADPERRQPWGWGAYQLIGDPGLSATDGGGP